MSTDAIKNISNGTTIKYLDTETCVDLSGYNNILGAVITSDVGNTFAVMLYKRPNWVKAFYRVSDSGGAISATVHLPIRVFYID